MPRSTHIEAIIGRDLYAKLLETHVLIVGAGGIGCELLKNIVMSGFGHITLLDLDTIDLSNLNRQFLFRKKDVKQSKAMVAAKTASQFNPSVKIYPIHANIKDLEYDVEWFSKFDIVLNALDNLDARRHVNKMCLAANVPLVESGTAGYLGQVQPILKDHTECFDCLPKATPKTFPVCTIRSTPSQPIHCIVWAKSYLLAQLFGEDEDDDRELDSALDAGEDVSEIASLKQQARAFRSIRQSLSSSATPVEEICRTTFQKVFCDDIKALLKMSDMWRSRKPPTPLEWDDIIASTPSGSDLAKEDTKLNGAKNGTHDGDKLKDQKDLTLSDCLSLFTSSAMRLAVRLRSGESAISFDKDDVDTLDFVTAAANLRSYAYEIQGKTKWEIKEMAGNIIPAIATTNAIISGVIVLQALHLLRRSLALQKSQPSEPPTKILRNVNIQSKPSVPLSASRIVPPNPKCSVCRDTYTLVRCDPLRTTLREIMVGISGSGDGENGGTGERDVSLFEANRLLADPDFDDNLDKTLADVAVGQGKFLTIVDEEGSYGNLSVAISALPPNHPSDKPHLILPSPLPLPPKVSKPTLKRPLSTPPPPVPSKRLKVNGTASSVSAPQTSSTFISPSRKQRLEEEGLVIVEQDEDIIVIDD